MIATRGIRTALCAAVAAGLALIDPGRPALADPPPVAKPSWWATFAGMKHITDDDDVQNTVPMRPDGFFRRYPEAHRAVWKKHGIDDDRIEHRVFAVESIGRHLNQLLGKTAFAWPYEPAGFAAWWDKDVLGPVADVYGDYFAPRSLANADLDAEYRKIHGKPAGAALTDEDRRRGVFDLSTKLITKYHEDALQRPTLTADLDARLLAEWQRRKVLAGADKPSLEDVVQAWTPAVDGATVTKSGGAVPGGGPRAAAHTFVVSGASFASVWGHYAAKCGLREPFAAGTFHDRRWGGDKGEPGFAVTEHETRPGERVSVFTCRTAARTASVSVQPKGDGKSVLCVLTVVVGE